MKNGLLGKKKSNDSKVNLVEVQLPAEALEIGMHVSRLDRPWVEVPILYQNFVLENQDDVDTLQEHCHYVFIEIDEAFLSELNLSTKKAPQLSNKEDKLSLHDALPQAKLVYDEAQENIDQVLERIATEETIDLAETKSVIRDCVKNILTNANALLWLTNIKDQDKYTAQHCLRVGIFAIALGRYIGLAEEEMELLGLCGVLHDVGKTRVPNDILNKPGKLTGIEYDIMKQHSNYGHEILMEYKDLEPMVRETCLYHHERIDGKGYPEELFAGYLNKYIRIVTIVDAYDAITSDRPYKSGVQPVVALKILYAERDLHFDKELVESFIQMIGIYPPGSLIEMTSGEVGVVVSSNSEKRLQPKVELMLNADKKKISPVIIDLAQDIKDKNGNSYAIKEGLTNGDYGVDVKDYIPQ